MRRGHAVLTLAALLLVGGPSGTEARAGAPRYTLALLPALQTDAGVFDIVEAARLNDRGEVAGTVRPRFGRSHAAFRYSPGRGMEDLDPDGRYRSSTLHLNQRGQVFGAVATGVGVPYRYRSHFVADRDGTFDLLETGLTREQRRRLRVNFARFSDAGEILTELSPDLTMEESTEFSRAFIYRRASGWEEITAGEPAFEGAHVYAQGLNKRGDAILGTGRRNSSGAEEFQNYIYRADGTVIEVPRFATSLNDSTEIVGVDYSRGESRRSAYYYSLGTDLVDLHPQGFAVSSAGRFFKGGSFLLSAREGKPKRNKWSLFMVDSELQTTLVYRWQQVRRFARRSGCRRQRLAEALGQGFNSRGEVAGLLLCKGSPNRRFFYSPERGFELMQSLLDEAGRPDVRTFQVRGLNEAGQILLNVIREDFAPGAALLTPVG